MGGELISINLLKNINKVLVLLGKFDRRWFWLGVFIVDWANMDGEGLKILSSPIERDISINEDLDMVGFMGRILDKILDKTRFSSDHLGVLDCRTWHNILEKTGISSDSLWLLDHRVLGRTGQSVFLSVGFLRGAPLCAEGEGSRSPINDRVVRF